LTTVLSALLSNANLWTSPCSTTDFMCTESQRALTNLFFLLKFNLSHKLQLLNVQYNFCSAMCYTVLIWTLILLTLGNILLQSFNWTKPVHYVHLTNFESQNSHSKFDQLCDVTNIRVIGSRSRSVCGRSAFNCQGCGLGRDGLGSRVSRRTNVSSRSHLKKNCQHLGLGRHTSLLVLVSAIYVSCLRPI